MCVVLHFSTLNLSFHLSDYSSNLSMSFWRSSVWFQLVSQLIGRQPGMPVRMPTPINQLFNDESIAVQIIFFRCLYVE